MPSILARRLARAAAACCGAAFLLTAGTGHAVVIDQRTVRLSVDPLGQQSAGASSQPVIAVDGRTVAWTSTGADLVPGDANGPIADVVAVDRVTGARRLVSEAPGGGDGPSTNPAISGDGSSVAFQSLASNLVPGDVNGHSDVFVRSARGAIVLVSRGLGGAPADGPSGEPDISADGQRVTFVSAASNLVPGDANGQADVFVFDLASATTTLVSVGREGGSGNGRSGTPAISGDGRFVAFESEATDLGFDGDANDAPDVFRRDLQLERTVMVSLADDGVQQSEAVAPPFRMQPDISRNGRFVVWDSDASNLTPRDRNEATDVFRRDLREDRTLLVSASSLNVQGDNDSFAPRLSSSGRFLAFQSVATNLVAASDDGPREDVFVRDLVSGTTTIGNVTASGSPRDAEVVGTPAQRPAISNSGRELAFTSTAPNLVDADTNGSADVFVRRLDPPETRIVARPARGRPRVLVAADDPAATRFVCRLDRGSPFACGPTVDLSRRIGRQLEVRAGGPGLLSDPRARRLQIWNDRRRPLASIRTPRGRSIREIRGTARDRGPAGVARIDVAVSFFVGGRGRNMCRGLAGRRFVPTPCERLRFVRAGGTSDWRLRLPRSISGPTAIFVRATDRAGNRSRTSVRQVVLR